jgi:hypothetical protein
MLIKAHMAIRNSRVGEDFSNGIKITPQIHIRKFEELMA